jgi:hypothetical protein
MLKKITLALAVVLASAITFGNASAVHAAKKPASVGTVHTPTPHGFCPWGMMCG